jgi:hypothetical protein
MIPVLSPVLVRGWAEANPQNSNGRSRSALDWKRITKTTELKLCPTVERADASSGFVWVYR